MSFASSLHDHPREQAVSCSVRAYIGAKGRWSWWKRKRRRRKPTEKGLDPLVSSLVNRLVRLHRESNDNNNISVMLECGNSSELVSCGHNICTRNQAQSHSSPHCRSYLALAGRACLSLHIHVSHSIFTHRQTLLISHHNTLHIHQHPRERLRWRHSLVDCVRRARKKTLPGYNDEHILLRPECGL
jgi:hypothetical protein